MVPALENSQDIRKHPEYKDIFLHGDKNLFSSTLQLLADQQFY